MNFDFEISSVDCTFMSLTLKPDFLTAPKYLKANSNNTSEAMENCNDLLRDKSLQGLV